MFKSHENKTILEHLKEVKENAKFMCKDYYDDALDILCCCHDFGKYTTYFQKYLKDKVKNNYANHGFISALFTAFIALDKFGEDSVLPLLLYNNVLHHHGSLKTASEDLPRNLRKGLQKIEDTLLFEKVETAAVQIEDMKKNRDEIMRDYMELGYGEYFNKFLEERPFKDILKKLKKIEYKFTTENITPEVYFKSQSLYSLLISSDKLSASNTVIPEDKQVPFETMEKAKNTKLKGKTTELNSIRKEIFDNIQKSLNESYKENSCFSITSPTGTGKTYSGFFAALKLRKLLKDNRKIIYALPFTSIINQNYQVIYDLFSEVEDFKKNSSNYLIKHHSLADVEYDTEYENYSVVQAQLLLENWNSSIVITTFVQLLQTLIGNKNRMLKKFNAFSKSIILLDEVQAIDIKYYALVDYILKAAAEELDCKIIMMTATRPMLLKDSKELLLNNEKYFSLFKRTKLMMQLSPVTVEEFAEEFIENLEDKSYLIICNTINQSLKLYNELKALDREVYYLSTNLIPKDRKNVIDNISAKLKAGNRPILVSTQVVEAGVDFDFDEVIRDIAPIDSIIQAAGRCNRNGEKAVGIVRVCFMEDGNEKSFGRTVYGHTTIEIAKELLQQYDYIEEKDYLNLIQSYFIKVTEKINNDVSKEFINSVNKLIFSSSSEKFEFGLDKFSLIDEKYNYIDVFMQCDDKAEEIYKKLINALAQGDMDKKSEKLLEIRKEVNDYTLSLPIKVVKDKLSINKNTLIISMDRIACDQYYDLKTGYKRSDDETYMIF